MKYISILLFGFALFATQGNAALFENYKCSSSVTGSTYYFYNINLNDKNAELKMLTITGRPIRFPTERVAVIFENEILSFDIQDANLKHVGKISIDTAQTTEAQGVGSYTTANFVNPLDCYVLVENF